MAETQIGLLFIRARQGRPLRVIEELTGINRETWRQIEVGGTIQPSRALLQAATQLAGAPTFEEMIDAVGQDVRDSYLPKENGRSPRRIATNGGKRRGMAIASTS